MFRIAAGAAIAIASLLGTGSTRADVLDFIRASKSLVVGVKADYRPFGFRDRSGAIVGFEPDLAADIARRLGVDLQLVPVTAGNRIELLQKGKIDIIIATMTDTPDRRKMAQIIQPFYYADFVNVLLRKNPAILKWEDLKEKTLCATAGSLQISIAQKYGAQVLIFEGADQPLAALESGKCAGYIYDQSYILGKMMEKRLHADFEMPLPGLAESPWVLAVRNGEDRFKKAVEDIVVDWQRSGFILELEQKWHIPAVTVAPACLNGGSAAPPSTCVHHPD